MLKGRKSNYKVNKFILNSLKNHFIDTTKDTAQHYLQLHFLLVYSNSSKSHGVLLQVQQKVIQHTMLNALCPGVVSLQEFLHSPVIFGLPVLNHFAIQWLICNTYINVCIYVHTFSLSPCVVRPTRCVIIVIFALLKDGRGCNAVWKLSLSYNLYI